MVPLQPLVDTWSRLSPRERGLAVAVAVLCTLMLSFILLKSATAVIGGLDHEIGRMQNDIVNYSYQIARRQSVEARFAQVASQHSSAWLESEIRDRLRQEIYRLSNLEPPGLDANGIPLSTNSSGRELVSIPELGSGRLLDGGDGFREYQIEFRIPPVPLRDLTAYLERLMESPQSLRVDRIDLRRDPGRPEVSANLVITRIVVDNPGGDDAKSDAASPLALNPADWTGEGCTVALNAASGGAQTLEATGVGERGRLFMERMLPASGVYEVELEIASSIPGSLGVRAGGVMLPSKGDAALRGDGRFYRYRFQFAVPSTGGRIPVAFPMLEWTGAESVVRVRNMRLGHATEMNRGA